MNIYKLIEYINKLIIKRNVVIFNSFPDVSGNALALYSYIIRERPDIVSKYRLVWCVDSKDFYKSKRILKYSTGVNKHNLIRKRSIKGVFIYLKARYIISTHGYFSNIKSGKNQKHFNLWHGMPMKKIGYLLSDKNGQSDNADYTIATSNVFKVLMAKAFNISEQNVFVTGQPCNDLLFNSNNSLKRLGIIKHNYHKVLIWMPTYRKSIIGDIRSDGSEDSFGVLSVLTEHLEEFNGLLNKLGYLLIIKPHPMDNLCKLERVDTDNIKIILNEDLEVNNILLYELLGEADILLTDYSSVFIDYLNLDRPIAFICDDIREYSETRGFCFESVSDFLPGEHISCYTELEDYLNNIDVINEQWRLKREKVNKLFNEISDNNNSKRVCNSIFTDSLYD